MSTMNDELMGALTACGFMTVIGGIVFMICHDSTNGASDKTKRFWKWWSFFWLAPIAFHVLRIVWLG